MPQSDHIFPGTAKFDMCQKIILLEEDLNPRPLDMFQMICLHSNCKISAVGSACQYVGEEELRNLITCFMPEQSYIG